MRYRCVASEGPQKIMIAVMTGTEYGLQGEKKVSTHDCFFSARMEFLFLDLFLLDKAGARESYFGYEGEIPPHRIPSLGFLWFAFPLSLLLIARTINV